MKLINNDTVEKALSFCDEAADLPGETHYSSMTYEDGVRDMVRIINGEETADDIFKQ